MSKFYSKKKNAVSGSEVNEDEFGNAAYLKHVSPEVSVDGKLALCSQDVFRHIQKHLETLYPHSNRRC